MPSMLMPCHNRGMRFAPFVVSLFLIPVLSCRTVGKPVEVTERGWIMTCSDYSTPESSAHGLPFLLFSTEPGGHFDTFIFSVSSVPPCSTWKKWDVHELDIANPSKPDYEITIIQHRDWKGEADGTWDLIKMRAL
jgi:hypothetical protein